MIIGMARALGSLILMGSLIIMSASLMKRKMIGRIFSS
jgi:hypothetical protein